MILVIRNKEYLIKDLQKINLVQHFLKIIQKYKYTSQYMHM